MSKFTVLTIVVIVSLAALAIVGDAKGVRGLSKGSKGNKDSGKGGGAAADAASQGGLVWPLHYRRRIPLQLAALCLVAGCCGSSGFSELHARVDA